MNNAQTVELRKKYKDRMVSNFKKIAEFYNRFAEKIQNDELISENDYDELAKVLCEKITITYDDGETNIMYLDSLFENHSDSKSI